MRYFFLIFIMALSSCTNRDNQVPRFIEEIDASGYKRYKPVDTLYKNKDYIATSCEDITGVLKSNSILLRMTNGRYFILDPDAYLENDSTIIYYNPPFKTENGSFQKDGIWFYARFVNDQINFGVDSLPVNGEHIVRPKSEGIYFYENNSLHKVSSQQTDEVFYDFGKDGFYFLPNTGRFFKRYSVAILK